ncbi:MAG: hypothetical protein E6J94_00970 [Methanobacteriota archaeon]|nr:MAG: hypothetical protein E6J94_00970 [Euryarchaeota archaeon]
MEPVPLPKAFDDCVLVLLHLVEGADRLAEMVLGAHRFPHPFLREADHRRVEEVPTVPERFRIEERRPLLRPVSARPFQPWLEDEDLVAQGHEVPLLRQNFPILHEAESLRDGLLVLREESLVDDRAFVQEERAEPGRDKQHAVAKRLGR